MDDFGANDPELAPLPPERPSGVTAAGILLSALGAIFVFFGLIALLVGGAVSGAAVASPGQDELLRGAASSLFGGIGAAIVMWGVVEIVTGAFVLRGAGWARIAGMVVAAVSGLLALSALFGRDPGRGLFFTVVVVAAYVYTVWALAANGRWFRDRGAFRASR